MNGKVTFVVSVVLACAVVGAAAEVEWTGKGAGDLWSTGDNWQGGKTPGPVDVIVLSSPPERGPVIDSDVTCGEIRGPAWRGDLQSLDVIEGGNVKIGGWLRFAEKGDSVGTINVLRGNVTIIGVLRCSNGSRANGIVNVVDGVVRADGMFLSDTGGGVMNVSGNSLVEFVNNLTFGGNRGKLPMTINMNGGIIRVGRELRCPSNSERAGQASINLYGGRIECFSFSHAEAAYTLDITEGELTIKGDVTAEIKEDIASGYITAFGGKDTVSCRYLSGSDRTIVTATNRKKARRPSPRNRSEDVKADSKLTWRAGSGGDKKYNLYIGMSLDAVGASAKAFKEGLSVNSFDPELGFNKTYHWRVDVIDQAGTVHKGTTWQFTTTDGKASDPSPAIKAERVASNVSLAWKGGLNATSHKVFFGSDPEKLEDKGIVSGNSFKPKELEFSKQYYWRVDAINASWKQSPWKGKLWSFTVDSGKATNPKPIDLAQWKPTKMTLSWKAARTTMAHTVYISDKLEDVKNGTIALSKAQKHTTYTLDSLKEATTYYWRVDQLTGDKVVKGDIWTFSTVGMLDLKVDLAVPQWYDRMKPRPGNVKPGWYTLCHPGWADMYMHDGVWLPIGKTTPDPEGILGTGIQVLIDNGKGGNGAVMGHGLCRGGLAGDLPVFGIPEGDPIANTYFYSCDWAGQKTGDGLVLIKGLPAGVYEVKSYHNHWEPSQQQTRNCHDHVSGMPPMPSVSANPVPTEGLPGSNAWDLVKGTGKGVVSLLEAKNVKVTSVLKDDEVATSLIKFSTDGSDVLIIYEAADNTYPDRARSGREGSRGIWNAFELKLIEARSGSGPKQVKDIFRGDKPGISWDGSVWYLDSDPERLFVNSDGDMEWTPKGREQFITSIPEQRLSKVGDVVEKSYMFMSDGDHDCEDCLKCPDSCFDDDITCLAGTSDIRVGLFESVERGPDHDGYKGFKGYNFRFGPNMMAGPTRWVDCTREVHKTGMFGKKPVNRDDLMSRNAGLMGRIPGFELPPGEYSFFNVRLERLSAKTVQLSITLNDRTISYTDDSADDQPQKIDVFAVSMRNKRPYTRLVLRAL